MDFNCTTGWNHLVSTTSKMGTKRSPKIWQCLVGNHPLPVVSRCWAIHIWLGTLVEDSVQLIVMQVDQLNKNCFSWNTICICKTNQTMNEWMNDWMNEWMDEWMNERMSEWMNEWINEWRNEWMKEGKNERMNESINDNQSIYLTINESVIQSNNEAIK